LCGLADDPARRASVLCTEGAGLHLEFLNGIDRRRISDSGAPDTAARDAGVVIDSIQQNVVQPKSASAGYERKIGPHALNRNRVPGQKPEREGIAPVEREIENS